MRGALGGFGEPGGGSVLQARARPCCLLRSVKLFPSPPSLAAHGGVQGVRRAPAFCSKSSNFGTMCTQPCHAALAGERAVGVVQGRMWGAPPQYLRRGVMPVPIGVTRGSPKLCVGTPVSPQATPPWCGGTRQGGCAWAHAAGKRGVPEISPKQPVWPQGGDSGTPHLAHSTTTAALPLHCAY